VSVSTATVRGMSNHLVTIAKGPAWDVSVPRRKQAGWDEHAEFMDGLVARGIVLLGGPVGPDVDTGRIVLAVEAADEAAVRRHLAGDPWLGTILTIERIEPWALWLRASSA
jgi:hypothetical protein